jgi:glycopeptide antibiotics resistance protein
MVIEINGSGFPTWLLAAAVAGTLLAVQLHRKQNWPYTLCAAIFSVYILKALDLTFFPIAINGTYVDVMRSVPVTSFINLVPFYLGQHHLIDGRDLLDFANNVLLTIPFGFGVSFVARLKRKDFLWLPLAVGFGIETGQFLISHILGYPYRVIDINDALLNLTGVIIGYGLFRFFAWGFLSISLRFCIRSGKFWLFFFEVASRA